MAKVCMPQWARTVGMLEVRVRTMQHASHPGSQDHASHPSRGGY